ncbi:flagellar biosynthetic protein FliR [Halobacteriovorax sp. HLS]|uniref:flagellar biosynthetic protein FliR n=1 Tax=Halobacteriovorax sp. HLS TaxID=2234000 RepID=UPI000FDB6D0B|nr:flagellar biosynthetic protein FliR [Halobacteriovorax sp. HLS]
MINIQVVDQYSVIAFWLCFTRFIAVNFQLPIFDNTSVPTIVKVLATLVMTYAFFPFLEQQLLKDVYHYGIDAFWFLTIFNTIVGLLVGFFVKVIMNIYTAAGSIITQQIGFGAIRYFDPSSSQQIGPFEQLIKWTVLIIILSSGALLPMFKGVFGSFFSIHAMDVGKFAASPEFYFKIFKNIFISALMLASPLIFTNMLIMTVLGVIARTVPQMNVIMVSFAVNIGLGLLVFIATSQEFFRVAIKMYTENLGSWFQFVI